MPERSRPILRDLQQANRRLIDAMRRRAKLRTALHLASIAVDTARAQVKDILDSVPLDSTERLPQCDNCGAPIGTNLTCPECHAHAQLAR